MGYNSKGISIDIKKKKLKAEPTSGPLIWVIESYTACSVDKRTANLIIDVKSKGNVHVFPSLIF